MGKYCTAVRKLEDKFEGLEFHHVERDRNVAADALSKLGSSRTQVPPGVFVQEVPRPSISSDQAEECNVLSQPESDSNDWREPIIRYIKNKEEPDDKAAAERIVRQLAHYTLIGDALYRRGATGVLMKCIPSVTGKQLLDEIHAGQCGIHAASRTLVGKVFMSGFYWPTTKSDAVKLVKRCEACQFLSKQQHLPAQQLQTIPVTWPFACWGLDMIGPFKNAQGGYTHVLVAIDKFTKWIEYKPIASLTSAKAVEFIQDIIFRFGISNSIITDLGSNFTSSEFFDFCKQRSIQIKYASVAHPRANDQVERANGMILEALRKKVFDKNEKFAGKWIRELPYVVWSLRTQPSRALHGNTPFFMVYGSEAVLPADLRFGAPRLVFENIAEAEATRLEDIDILEEERLNTVIQSARYQQTLRRYHDKTIRHRSFIVGDLVLRRILTGEGRHKLSPLWEGPFIVSEVTRSGSYRLTQMDGTEVGNSWNIEHLRKFYP
jgi:transposase InsO family protein